MTQHSTRATPRTDTTRSGAPGARRAAVRMPGGPRGALLYRLPLRLRACQGCKTASNSRHSPLDMPEFSCVTSSPASIRRMQSKARDDRVAPPIR